MKTIIYTLSDPQTLEVRYIGKTRKSLNYRLYQHLREATKKIPTYKNKV